MGSTPGDQKMADIHTKAARSKNMAAVKNKNTKPEMQIRKELHKRGFRYSLHNKKIPGKPDLYFRKYNAALFINGCFWHMHDCPRVNIPETNSEFWEEKLNRNKERDKEVRALLDQAGIRHMTVWECDLRGKNKRPLKHVCDDVQKWLELY